MAAQPALRRAERWICLSDSHGDEAHLPSLRVALEFSRYWKPTVRIAGGDHFDLRPLRKGASEEDKGEKISDDLNSGCEFLRRFKPTHWVWGNHDDRILDAQLSRDTVKREYALELHDKIKAATPKGCIEFPYSVHRPMRYGNFLFMHGFATGVNSVRRQLQTFHENVIVGHVHRFDRVRAGTLHGFSNACLCRLDMPFSDRQLSSVEHEHGFLFGWKTVRGKLIIHNAFPIDGVWYFPTELKEIRHAEERR